MNSDQAELYRPDDSLLWRQEVASRVDAFCARRGRKRGPRVPSMNLDFERAARATAAAHFTVPDTWENAAAEPETEAAAEASNIIEFPKPPAVAPAPPSLELPLIEELAEPILEKPRILEAEEPQDIGLTFGGRPLPSITLDAEPDPLDAAPLAAPLPHRIISGALDGIIVGVAVALFATIFLRTAAALPRTRVALLAAVIVPLMLWTLYQYVFLVYGAATPGMRLVRLGLATFEGDPVPRSLRRWRAAAILMSATALGLGYLWALIDEQGLCWHDRITRTCPRKQ
ncbi:MAG TPA: RDD family protein [Terriglobales bacterium]|nr:RDD family protein [Terriglobales bacterium]